MSLFSCLVCAAKDQKFRDSTEAMRRSMQPRSQIFSFKDLQKATSSFNSKHKLGYGGFGSVYKGALPDGRNIAVKKLSQGSDQGDDEFVNEVKVLTTVEHQNLIRLLGCCIHGSDRMLVYEYMPKGSLDKYLFKSTKDSDLDWHERHNIIVGTAKGLYYLHEGLQEKIIHRDIKASNILLDERMIPKIADFGLAKLFNCDGTHISTKVAGTRGYLAPEYFIQRKLTHKADVYSFGVLVLEIVSGTRNSDKLPSLLDLAWTFYQETRLLDLVDARIRDKALPAEDVKRVMHIALLCTQEKAELRPDMSGVISLLGGQSKILEKPTKPPFLGIDSNTIRGDTQPFVTAGSLSDFSETTKTFYTSVTSGDGTT